jgi:hypothetical protein
MFATAFCHNLVLFHLYRLLSYYPLAGPASRLEKKLQLLSEEDTRVLLVRLYTMIRLRLLIY